MSIGYLMIISFSLKIRNQLMASPRQSTLLGSDKTHKDILTSSWPPSCDSPTSGIEPIEPRTCHGIRYWSLLVQRTFFHKKVIKKHREKFETWRSTSYDSWVTSRKFYQGQNKNVTLYLANSTFAFRTSFWRNFSLKSCFRAL